MERVEVWWAKFPSPIKRRPVLILSRNRAVQVRDYVTVAQLTTNIRNIPSEVSLDTRDNLPKPCVVNLDVIDTIPKKILSNRIGLLSRGRLGEVEQALKYTLAIS